MICWACVFTTAKDCDLPCLSAGTILYSDMIRYRHGFLHGGVYKDEDVRFLQFVQWAFAARAGSLILKEAARTAKRNILQGATTDEALTATGPAMFTRVVLNHLTEFNLTKVEHTGAVYVTKYGERVAVLPYRAFGIHPLHKNVNRGKPAERLLLHAFKGRWRSGRNR